MTFYEVLELDPDASTAEIERAFRRLARKVHPDLNTDRGAETRMKLLNEIRDTLTDPLRRATYDAELLHETVRHARHGSTVPNMSAVDGDEPARDDVTSSRRGRSSWPRRVALGLGVGTIAAVGFIVADPLLDDAAPPSVVPLKALDAAVVSEARVNARPTPTATSAPLAPAASPPARGGRGGRALVRIGSRVDDVLRTLGRPTRIVPGARRGDATFIYGKLKLEIKNGRVAGGNAAE